MIDRIKCWLFGHDGFVYGGVYKCNKCGYEYDPKKDKNLNVIEKEFIVT